MVRVTASGGDIGGRHLSAAELRHLIRGAEPAGSVAVHLEQCSGCAQRIDVGRARSLDDDAIEAALSREADRDGGDRPAVPERHLVAGFSRRLEQILKFAPLIRLRAHDEKRQFRHLGRLEAAVVLLNGVLHRMESGDAGATRDQLVRETCAAIAWQESNAPGFQTTVSERRALVEDLLDELTNARAQGRAFTETFQGYHLDAPSYAVSEFRLLLYREHDGEMKYVLTDQGLDLVYRLHEVDHFLTVEMELMLLLRQVQRGQFEKALSSLERLATACGIQRRRIDHIGARIRRDPLSVSPTEIGENDAEVRQQFDEEKKLFKKIRSAVEEQSDRLADLFASANEKHRLAQIGRIRSGLNRSFQVHQALVSNNLKLRRDYHEALERHASLRRRYRQLKIEPEVLEPLLGLPPDADRAIQIAQLIIPLRRPRLFAPWQLPFARRAEPGETASSDEFPVDLDGLPPGGATVPGFDLADQADAHAALLQALVEVGGTATLSQLIGRDALATIVTDRAHLLSVHVLLLHNVRTVRLGDPGDPFTPVHRLARARVPAIAQRAVLELASTPSRCRFGNIEMTDVHFHLRTDGAPDAVTPR